MSKVLEISNTVKRLLFVEPKTRDSDELLILKVWEKQNPNLRNISFVLFATGFVNKKFASPRSISRARRKLQQEFKELRGNNYIKRMNHQEQVKEDLRHPEMKAGGTP